MPEARRYGDLVLFRRLLHEARPYWGAIAVLLVLQLLATPLALLTPVPIKLVVDSVLGQTPLPPWLAPFVPSGIAGDASQLLWFAVSMLVAVALVSYLRVLLVWLLSAYAGNKVLVLFRAKLFSHMQQLSFTYHDHRGSMDSLYRIQYDTTSIQEVATEGVIPFIASGVTLFAIVWITMQIDLAMALVALCIVPPLFVLTNLSRKLIRDQWDSLKEKESLAISVVQETLGALRVIKAFGKETQAKERFESRSHLVVKDQLRVAWTEGGFDLLIAVTIALGTAGVLYLGVRQVQSGTITLGELLLIMAYLAQLYGPLQTITQTVAHLQSAMAGAERVFSVLDEEPQITERADAKSIERTRGEIEFRDVDFSYGAGRPVLSGASFHVKPCSRVGIFGPTGSGKTSLVSLLLRFFDPARGTIALDGVDLRDYKLADLRAQYGMVLQDSVLFSASLAENIAYSHPDATQEQIVEAARAANAHDFIDALPEGYATVVGERGMLLSGGERQRISLARAFLRNAPILILDEPTSAVDTATERQIIDALDRLMQGRTTFMIAHRMSTLESCDLWLELESGRPPKVHQVMPAAAGIDAHAAPRSGLGA